MYSNYLKFEQAPGSWSEQEDDTFSSLHQLSPYIGKLKPQIARLLIEEYTKPGDMLVDPFCGSGSIPLEAHLAGRGVIASDVSPYAYLLTKSKLAPPSSASSAKRAFDRIFASSRLRAAPEMSKIPDWVRAFFHPVTLNECLQFADECIAKRNHFLLACLLGILHHQRPGFLSFPSSHLVPYLRDKKFPRSEFPSMYEYRELPARMHAKIDRAFKVDRRNKLPAIKSVLCTDIRRLTLPGQVDSIITSPPYMNALDYHRDNRLRLWFLDRATQNYSPEPTDRQAGLEAMVTDLVAKSRKSLRRGGRLVLIVGETVLRKRIKSHPSQAFSEAIEATNQFSLVEAIRDHIPDIRRSRKHSQATKAEHVLVYERIR